MLDEELIQITNKINESRNLKVALLSLVTLIVYGVVTFMAYDSFKVGHGHIFLSLLIGASYGLLILSLLAAIFALKKALNCTKKFKSSRNYVSIGISILVIFLIIIDVLNRI